MEEGAVELEGGRGVGVVVGEVHLGFEVAAVVERIGVDDDEGDVPVEDVVVVELERLVRFHRGWMCGCEGADLNVDPFLLRESLELVLEDLARCHLGSAGGVERNGYEWVDVGGSS